MITRRNFLKGCAAAVGAGFGAGLYTWRVEPHWLEVVERRLPLAFLPPDLAGRRLVHISDVHVGPEVDHAFLRRSFARVQRLEPDYVVYTGDFITHSYGIINRCRSIFPHFARGRRGTFGALGNHDYGHGWAQPEVAEAVAAVAASAGIRILRNAVAEAGGLHVVGLDDLWAGRFEPQVALQDLPAKTATLVLSHNPDTADLPGWDGFASWILAGHTHGGQCKPPFLPPPLLPVSNRRYTAGEFALAGGRRMYINRGLGHLLPVRFNVRPEITVFYLERAPAV